MSNRDQRPDGNPWPIDAYLTSGIQLADYLNAFVESVDTNNLGTSRPAYLEGGGLWSKEESDGSVGVYVYTGSVDVKIGNSNGAGLDIINEILLLEWIEENIDTGVSSFTGSDGSKRIGDVVAEDGDYKIQMMDDYGGADGDYTSGHAIVADGTEFNISPIANSFTGTQGSKRQGDIVAIEGDYRFDQLGDVALNNLVKDDYVQWNGTSWENNPPKLIETELNFMGGYDVTTQPPAGPQHGDMYINNNKGTAASGWTGIAGTYVNVGNAMGYSKNHNANGDQVAEGTGGCWFLMGEVFTGGITSIGEGSGIKVNASTPATPVVSVNKTTLDGWYSLISHKHDDLYAKINHNHDGDYADVNHLHSEYELKFSKNTAFNKNFGNSAGTVAEGNHGHSNYALSNHNHSNEYAPLSHTHPYEPAFTKNTAFNKTFGAGYENVARGSHVHDGQYAPTAHNHSAANITAGTFASNSVYYFRSGIDLGDRLNVTYIDASSVIRSKADVIAYYTSDERLKDNITPIEGALEKILKLRGVEYDWNDKTDLYEGHDYSVIAQDVEAVFPELVREQASGYKGVKIEKLISPMIEAIRELSEEVRMLKAEVAELKGDD